MQRTDIMVAYECVNISEVRSTGMIRLQNPPVYLCFVSEMNYICYLKDKPMRDGIARMDNACFSNEARTSGSIRKSMFKG